MYYEHDLMIRKIIRVTSQCFSFFLFSLTFTQTHKHKEHVEHYFFYKPQKCHIKLAD